MDDSLINSPLARLDNLLFQYEKSIVEGTKGIRDDQSVKSQLAFSCQAFISNLHLPREHALAEHAASLHTAASAFSPDRFLPFMKALLETLRDHCEGTLSLQVSNNIKITKQGVYFSGQTYDAMSKLGSILSAALHSIRIVDNYISKDVLDLLSAKVSSVAVLIITRECFGSLKAMVSAFNQQYGGLEIRTSESFHDRFVFVDQDHYYHFGASLKDLGKRVFMFSRIEEPSLIANLEAMWKAHWTTATKVI